MSTSPSDHLTASYVGEYKNKLLLRMRQHKARIRTHDDVMTYEQDVCIYYSAHKYVVYKPILSLHMNNNPSKSYDDSKQ
jgi:hypothetical protein